MQEREFLVIVRVHAKNKRAATNNACELLNRGGDANRVVDLTKITCDDAAEITSPLSENGYAVILWTPKELRDAAPGKVQDRLIELGWGVINCYQ